MLESLKTIIRRSRLLTGMLRVARTRQLVLLDYRFDSKPRWGHGRPPHAELYDLLNAGRSQYRQLLSDMLALREPLGRIDRDAPNRSAEPRWRNGYLPALDAVVLYSLLALRRPRRYIEIGSGNSTAFVRRAIHDCKLTTTITSIDPQPRREIDALCDTVIRRPLEAVDAATFDVLEAGDVLFMDGSHRSFMNSDTTVFFLEVLPRLKPGVLVQIHDILLPYDYPPDYAPRYYSEQYLLACYLLARTTTFRVLLPNAFISEDRELHGTLDPIWQQPALRGVSNQGISFWIEKS